MCHIFFIHSSKSFTVLYFKFGPMIHFASFFCVCVFVCVCIKCMCVYLSATEPSVKKTFLFSLNCVVNIVKNQQPKMWEFISKLPIRCATHIDDYSFLVRFEISTIIFNFHAKIFYYYYKYYILFKLKLYFQYF